jgi:5'-nucleotidase
VAGYAAQLDTVRKRFVAHAAAPIGTENCRVGECPLGDIIADAMRATTHGADVALMNAGGIRTGLPGGDVTLGDVLTMLPFGNTVATLKMTGADLRAALANGVARTNLGGFTQISGARITWRPKAEAANRLVSVEIGGPEGRYAPLDPSRIYTVVTNNFMRMGGDGYTMMRDRAIDPYDSGPNMDEAVIAALPAALATTPRTDGRFVPID